MLNHVDGSPARSAIAVGASEHGGVWSGGGPLKIHGLPPHLAQKLFLHSGGATTKPCGQCRSRWQSASGQTPAATTAAWPALSSKTPKDAACHRMLLGAGYRQSGQDSAEAIDLSTRMVTRLVGMPMQALITSDETGSTVDFQLISGGKVFSLREAIPLDAMLKDLQDAVERALGLRLNRITAFSEHDPSNKLDNSCELKKYNGKSLVLTFYDDFGDCRRFLQAMEAQAFNPKSEGFNVNWTLKAFAGEPEVRAGDVLNFLQTLEVPEGKTVEFMQIFGRLTSMAEQWNMFCLALLQHFDPGLRTFKHFMCQHWLHLAKDSVTQKVPQSPPPVFLPRLSERAAVIDAKMFSVDGCFPAMFPHNLQLTLKLNDVDCTRHSMLVCATLNFDWFSDQWVEKYKEAVQKDTELEQGEALKRHDVVRMVHVQLRLSCEFRVVEVEGKLHIPLLQCAAKLLQWHLEEVTQESRDLELQHMLNDLLADAKKEVQQLGMRGVLMLVHLSSSHTQDDLRLCLSLSDTSVRFILCYPEGAPEAAATTDAGAPK